MANLRGVASIGLVNLQNVSELTRSSAYYRRAPGAKMLPAGGVDRLKVCRFPSATQPTFVDLTRVLNRARPACRVLTTTSSRTRSLRLSAFSEQRWPPSATHPGASTERTTPRLGL